MSTTYLCVVYFLSRSFLAVTHFVILCSGYRFTEGIRFVHPNAAQLSAIFSQNPQIRNWCINWWKLCSLAVHYFPGVFLSVFFFCLPDMCAYAINFPTRSQTKISPTKAVTYPRHFFVDREVKKLSILETTLPTKVDILKVY